MHGTEWGDGRWLVDCVVEVRVTDENLPFAMVRAPLTIKSTFEARKHVFLESVSPSGFDPL